MLIKVQDTGFKITVEMPREDFELASKLGLLSLKDYTDEKEDIIYKLEPSEELESTKVGKFAAVFTVSPISGVMVCNTVLPGVFEDRESVKEYIFEHYGEQIGYIREIETQAIIGVDVYKTDRDEAYTRFSEELTFED